MPQDIHIIVTSHSIHTYMDADRNTMMCFRCGQKGHARYQCLSFKVRLCSHYENGGCNNPDCNFAHGVDELRTPWRMRCVRVVKQGGQMVCIGCNSTEHTFRKCPLHKDLLML